MGGWHRFDVEGTRVETTLASSWIFMLVVPSYHGFVVSVSACAAERLNEKVIVYVALLTLWRRPQPFPR